MWYPELEPETVTRRQWKTWGNLNKGYILLDCIGPVLGF